MGGFLVLWFAAPSFGAELKTHVGPVSIERYSALKTHLGVEKLNITESYLKNAVFNYFINMLVDDVLQSDGKEFCLPVSWRTLPTGQVFFMLVPEIDKAEKGYNPDVNIRTAVVSYLATRLPCSKT